ncbi:MAG: AmmeMemoRadiSam system protein B [SAR324 cluster bacterium]|nr:AmmeMemoRadiSam system protein B [SAR324 cluster bacterium]
MMTRQETTESVRPPAVASLFYPGEAAELKQNLREMLDEASEAEDPNEDLPADQYLKALIVPHAGYVYSGTTAARAYHLLRKNRDDFRRVIILGPAHRVWLEGIAFPGTDAFETPLGRIPLAKQQIRELLRFPEVQLRDDAHQDEHCLEVQLPFLQEILNEFELIPAVVGEISPDSLSGLLENLLEDPQNLLLLSTDLSHFHSYSEAQEIDQETAEAIETFEDDKILPEQACGTHPLRGLLRHARIQGWKIQRLGLCNSGDTAGSKDRVVGYGAWALSETVS